MAPKAREIDLSAVQERLKNGESRRDIARSLEMPESTLRHRLNKGIPKIHQGIPDVTDEQDSPRVEGVPQVYEETPPLYVHQGIPDSSTEDMLLLPESQAETLQELSSLPLPGIRQVYPEIPSGIKEQNIPLVEGVPQVHQEISPLYVHEGTPDSSTEESVGVPEGQAVTLDEVSSLPFEGIQQGYQGIPQPALSPQLAEALTTAWPTLQSMLAWWRDRQQAGEAPAEKLERATFHIAPRWITAIRREADQTGESYAAVVNRAFRQYFAER